MPPALALVADIGGTNTRVALADGAAAGLADQGEGWDHHVVQALAALLNPHFKGLKGGGQVLGGLGFFFQCIDRLHDALHEALHVTFVVVEHLVEEAEHNDPSIPRLG